jgi:hypothetical protein
VLPTLGVIIWAYGMYALFSLLFRRRSGQPSHQSRWRKLRGFTLVGGVVAVGLVLWCCYTPDKNDQRLKLAGFLGTVYAEGWPDRLDQTEYPPVKAQHQGVGEQPAYALLHPGTPTTQVEPEKKLIRPRPSRAATTRKTAGVQENSGKTSKVAKTAAPSSKKSKMANKNRTRKKKRTSALKIGPMNAG